MIADASVRPEVSRTLLDPSPYVGPKPFAREDQARFFGRKREEAEVVSLIVAHPVLILYAQSGAGKSSLINAKVIPRLQARGADVMPVARVSGQVPAGVDAAAVTNIYAMNVIGSLETEEASEATRVEAGSVAAYLSARLERSRERAKLRVLVIDQFEEVFTFRPDRWADRAGFFEDLANALAEDSGLRIVLAMREEFIAGVEPYAGKLPEWGRTRFRLERLGPEAALEAIVKPAEAGGRRFAPGAAETLLHNLRLSVTEDGESLDQFVEPLQLQVVCHQLWRSLRPEATVISDANIVTSGNVDEALGDYYEHCLDDTVGAGKVQEAALRRWIEERLVTTANTRGLVFMGQEETEGMANTVVARLEKGYLIHPEQRGGRTWYELSHDRFIAPIKASNDRWRGRQGERVVTGRQLEEAAAKWAHLGKPSNLLLSEALFSAAEAWADDAGDEASMSPELREYYRQSEAATARRRRTRIASTVAIIATVIVGVAVSWGIRRSENQELLKRQVEDILEKERTQVAASYLADGREHDALAMIVKAAGDSIRQHGGPSPETEEVLRRAVDLVGTDRWLLPANGPQQLPMFSRNGSLIVTQRPGAVELWSTDSGARVALLERDARAHADTLTRTLFLGERKILLQNGADLGIWDSATGAVATLSVPALAAGDGGPTVAPIVRSSRDGRFVSIRGVVPFARRAAGTPDWKVASILSVADNRVIYEIENVASLVFSNARPQALVVTEDEKGFGMERLDLETRGRTTLPIRPGRGLERVAFSENGDFVLVLVKRGELALHDTQTGRRRDWLGPVSDRASGWNAAMSADAGVLVRYNDAQNAAGEEINVEVVHRATRRNQGRRLALAISDVFVSLDGRDMAVLGRRGDGIYVVERFAIDLGGKRSELWSPKPLGTFTAFPSRPTSVDRVLRYWYRDDVVTVLDLVTGENHSENLPGGSKGVTMASQTRLIAYSDEKNRTRIRKLNDQAATVEVRSTADVFAKACAALGRHPSPPKDALATCATALER